MFAFLSSRDAVNLKIIGKWYDVIKPKAICNLFHGLIFFFSTGHGGHSLGCMVFNCGSLHDCKYIIILKIKQPVLSFSILLVGYISGFASAKKGRYQFVPNITRTDMGELQNSILLSTFRNQI